MKRRDFLKLIPTTAVVAAVPSLALSEPEYTEIRYGGDQLSGYIHNIDPVETPLVKLMAKNAADLKMKIAGNCLNNSFN